MKTSPSVAEAYNLLTWRVKNYQRPRQHSPGAQPWGERRPKEIEPDLDSRQLKVRPQGTHRPGIAASRSAMGRLDAEGNCVNARLTRDVSRITLSQSCLSSGWWFAECIMKNTRIMTNMTSAAYECKSWPQLRCQRP